MAAIEARRDLLEKLKLERKLMRELAVFNKKIVRETVVKYGNDGITFDAAELQPELADILENHYNRTSDIFSTQIADELPDDIGITDEEKAVIAGALSAFFMTRSNEQSAIITETNQKNIDDSIQFGIQTSQETEGGLSRQEQAMVAGAALSRKLKGREGGIAVTETQTAAETSKGTEAEVLAGRQPSIAAGSPVASGVDKEWVTVGDEKVRAAHVNADSQTVDVSKPFQVGGELLRWPGDTSLGASAGNIVNCRCASVYDTAAIFAVRRRRGAEATEVIGPAEPLAGVG